MSFGYTVLHDSYVDTADSEESGSVSTDNEASGSDSTGNEESVLDSADSEESGSGSPDKEESDSADTKGTDSDSTDSDKSASDSTDGKDSDISEIFEGIVLSDSPATSEYTDTTLTCLTFGVFFYIGLFLARMTWGYLK